MESVDNHDSLSWEAATAIMMAFSVVAVTTMLLGMNPFSLLFNVSLVYLPTAILIGSTLFDRSKRPS